MANTQVGYLALERFSPDDPSLENYFKSPGFSHFTEIITLDYLLCPNILRELTREDWNHNLADPGMTWCFDDLEYLLTRVGTNQDHQVLAVVKNPDQEIDLNDPRFSFIGYDLVEIDGGISALTNCGGFDAAFHTEELTHQSLLPTLASALRVNALLKEHYPEEHHAQCNVWAIWRMERI